MRLLLGKIQLLLHIVSTAGKGPRGTCQVHFLFELMSKADPIIFRPLKALTLGSSQQETLLRVAQEGISVYCPHTAVDAATNGMTDWLADVLTHKTSSEDDDNRYCVFSKTATQQS